MGATAGALGEIGNQADEFEKRRQIAEQQRLEREIAERKEAALLARQEALLQYNYDREDRRDAREEAKIESREKIEAGRITAQEERENRRDARIESNAERRHRESLGGGSKKAEFEKKLEVINNDPDLSPEEKRELKLKIYGKDTSKGKLTEAQELRAYDKLAEYEAIGVDETNVAAVNRLRDQLGMPKLVKKLLKKGESKFFGKDTEDEYEYVEAGGEPEGEPGGTPALEQEGTVGGEIGFSDESEKGVTDPEADPAPTKTLSLEEAKAILSGKSAEPAAEPEEPSALEDASEMSTDVGTVMGEAAKGIVNTTKLAGKTAKQLMAIDREITARLKSHKATSKNGLILLQKEIAKILGTKVDPVKELNKSKVRGNYKP
jgi:hypothetical protein